MPPELPASFGRIGGIEDGGDGANARRPGLEDFADIAQVDSPYGKPGYLDVRRRPTHVVQGHGRNAGLGRSGINGADGNVGRMGGHGAKRLRGRVSAEAE
jgi:hypothetical protein